MDKVSKLLKRLTEKERSQVMETIEILLSRETNSLDIKKLRGADSIYRVRVGNIRILFRKEVKDVRILEISRRDDTTYSKY